MAKVKVRWQTIDQWEAEVEIDGYDPEAGVEDVDSVLAELEGDQPTSATFLGCIERAVLEETVVREGDEPLPESATKIRAPQHEPEW